MSLKHDWCPNTGPCGYVCEHRANQHSSRLPLFSCQSRAMGSQGVSGLEKQLPAGLRAEGEQQKLTPVKAQRAGARATADSALPCCRSGARTLTHFLNPKFFQSSLIFICNPGLFSASWCFLFWMFPGFLLRPLTRAGTRGLILVVERQSVELALHSPGTWREIRI